MKILLDCVFGRQGFRNEVVWCYGSGGASRQHFSRKHDTIFFYTKSERHVFNVDDVREDYSSPEKSMTPKIIGEKRYQKMHPLGRIPFDWWTIPVLTNSSKERTGYPTQKPLALLHRIVKASSREGDIVLDPFCGCATTCVAAQQLGRKWIGIDIEKQAVKILIARLSDDAGLFKDFIATEKIPRRTDVREKPPDKSVKERLYAEQQGRCNACGTEFDIRNLEIDHIIPQSKGGGDYYENYQLLCGSCNRIKGDRPMEYLRMQIETREKFFNQRVLFGE